jgi:hypothetical protein
VIGYGGSERYVACYGDRYCGVVKTFDGRAVRCGRDYVAWLCFLEHNQVWPHLTGYDVQAHPAGHSAAEHALLLDRAARVWYVGPLPRLGAWLAARAGTPIKEEPC